MKRIFRMLKYPLFDMDSIVDDRVVVRLPQHVEMHLGMQGTVITLWALVDEASPAVERVFRVYGTGHVIDIEPCYVGTVFDRSFVWHVVEEFPGVRP